MSVKGIGEVIDKYVHLIRTESFAKYEKDFTRRIQEGLIKGFNQGFNELDLVREIVNSVNRMSKSFDKFKITTRGIFIHGSRSRVEFEYYGKRVRRELGDLIFILSIIYNGKKYFEKLTISQAKKGDSRLRWNLSNKEQVYLLSRFPPFRGVKGSIIPSRDFNLPNHSGCLGSFNLLFEPGDFIFISAQRLESIVANRKSVSINALCRSWKILDIYPLYSPYLYYYEKDIRFLYFLLHLTKNLIPPFVGVLGYSHYSPNVYDFSDKYLRGYIGELIYSKVRIYNKPALEFLLRLFYVMKEKARREKINELEEFVREFLAYPYANYKRGVEDVVKPDSNGGGIGIIYTLINLGERME